MRSRLKAELWRSEFRLQAVWCRLPEKNLAWVNRVKEPIREWHTGDKHHKKDIVYAANERCGVMVRILRSLAAVDAWTFDKGFVGAVRAGESFMWHPEDGLIAQFTAMPKSAR